jgi:hypothetical protein
LEEQVAMMMQFGSPYLGLVNREWVRSCFRSFIRFGYAFIWTVFPQVQQIPCSYVPYSERGNCKAKCIEKLWHSADRSSLMQNLVRVIGERRTVIIWIKMNFWCRSEINFTGTGDKKSFENI